MSQGPITVTLTVDVLLALPLPYRCQRCEQRIVDVRRLVPALGVVQWVRELRCGCPGGPPEPLPAWPYVRMLTASAPPGRAVGAEAVPTATVALSTRQHPTRTV